MRPLNRGVRRPLKPGAHEGQRWGWIQSPVGIVVVSAMVIVALSWLVLQYHSSSYDGDSQALLTEGISAEPISSRVAAELRAVSTKATDQQADMLRWNFQAKFQESIGQVLAYVPTPSDAVQAAQRKDPSLAPRIFFAPAPYQRCSYGFSVRRVTGRGTPEGYQTFLVQEDYRHPQLCPRGAQNFMVRLIN